MKTANKINISKVTLVAIKAFGQMIKAARLERSMSQENLAQRINISRYTIMSIEKGSLNVSIAAYFEAAYIVGLQLMGSNENELNKVATSISNLVEILPKKAKTKMNELDDNF